jgi:hypothetical protein
LSKPLEFDPEELVQLTIRLEMKDWQRLKILAAKLSAPGKRVTLQSMMVMGLNLLLDGQGERKLSTKVD